MASREEIQKLQDSKDRAEESLKTAQKQLAALELVGILLEECSQHCRGEPEQVQFILSTCQRQLCHFL